MKIELWRRDDNARGYVGKAASPQGEWLAVEDMIEDLQSGKIKLQPGDKLFVHDSRPSLRVVR